MARSAFEPKPEAAGALKERRVQGLALVRSEKYFDGQEGANPNSKPAPLPVWNGAEYKRIGPGQYTAAAVRVQGPEWVRQYSRWSLLVEFELLGESDAVRVCAFFNMGTDRKGPKIGRQSRFFRAWTTANGGLPSKGQEMDPKVFLEGQVFEIEVEDSSKDSDENLKNDSEVYSKVTRILSMHWPNRVIQNPSVMNQES